MLDPLLYRWGVPPVVIRCVHWTMQMWVLQTGIKAQGIAIVMVYVFINHGSIIAVLWTKYQNKWPIENYIMSKRDIFM